MIYLCTFPERLRFDLEDRPKDLPSAHPDACVEIEAPDETKARKYAIKALGHTFADLRLDDGFGTAMFPLGTIARVWKGSGKGVVEMEAVL